MKIEELLIFMSMRDELFLKLFEFFSRSLSKSLSKTYALGKSSYCRFFILLNRLYHQRGADFGETLFSIDAATNISFHRNTSMTYWWERLDLEIRDIS